VKLQEPERSCQCGKSTGNLKPDGLHATIRGRGAVCLGLENTSLTQAVLDQPFSGKGKEFTAFVIPVNSDRVEVVP